ncbi:MAG: membrane protein insertase YidC [Candidatus Obscuribacterales bacterium]|nr:membrane protein insertase YidC [Candidatus Obscuribacterales bacterium]
MDITYSFMLPVLEEIAKFCHSYGWAIVFLTILVRILVYPLVASSTRSMQRMSQLQPQLKIIQDRYKNDPEKFQKKAAEFYQKNQINPVGGCLPTLVQLPILFALFAAFTGPPFGDKAIPVKIHVVSQQDAAQVKKAEVSGGNSAYVSREGNLAKVIVFPGDSTVVAGDQIVFGTRAVDGTLPNDFKVEWKITGDAHGATVNSDGTAVFPQTGDVTVEAMVPGIAKSESFGFISSLGKVAKGLDLLKPANWDNLFLILMFGATMYLSQKLMVQPQPANADPEQVMIQKQTQRTMPIALTGMFFFIPLPSGVFLYMVISNIIQSLQTWLIMRKPAPAIVDVLSDGPPAKSSENMEGTVIDVIETNGETGEGKKKSKKKKSPKKEGG